MHEYSLKCVSSGATCLMNSRSFSVISGTKNSVPQCSEEKICCSPLLKKMENHLSFFFSLTWQLIRYSAISNVNNPEKMVIPCLSSISNNPGKLVVSSSITPASPLKQWISNVSDLARKYSISKSQ